MNTNTDLPTGYRWATGEECEAYAKATSSVQGAIVVPRTVDSNGVPYTQDEADLAVPTQSTLIAESLERENNRFRSYTDRGVNPHEPDIG